jgi:hypothetical protein
MWTERVGHLKRNPLVREGAPLLGLYWLYSCIRWLIASDSPSLATANALAVIRFEKQMGVFVEPHIQDWILDHAMGIVHFANAFYTLGYFPALVLFGVLLYRFYPCRFRCFRATFLVSLAVALICFTAYPLAPPRLVPQSGLVDTQEAYSSNIYNRKLVLSFYNPYAAMPSLHFAWALLTGATMYSLGRRLLKLIGIVYPTMMASVIVITGHHFLLDIVGGALTVSFSYGLVSAFPRAFKRTPVAVPLPLRDAVRRPVNPLWQLAKVLSGQPPSRARAGDHAPSSQSSIWALLTNQIPTPKSLSRLDPRPGFSFWRLPGPTAPGNPWQRGPAMNPGVWGPF